jgi:hypothetical protein
MPIPWLPIALATTAGLNLWENRGQRKSAEAEADWRRQLLMEQLGFARQSYLDKAPLRQIGLGGVMSGLAGLPQQTAFSGARGAAGSVDPFALLSSLYGMNLSQPKSATFTPDIPFHKFLGGGSDKPRSPKNPANLAPLDPRLPAWIHEGRAGRA